MKAPGGMLAILAKSYPAPYWAFMREFRNATGFDAIRSADALAVGLYRSRGQVIVGFEQKIYRNDWLRELKRPEKAEPIAQFCDYFNVVTPDESIAKVEELPAPWGLIVIDHVKGKARTIKKAELLKPAAVTRPFMCAIIKQAMDAAAMPGVEALAEAREAGRQEGIDGVKHGIPYELEELRRLKKNVEAFQQASGVELSGWQEGRRIGEAVALLEKLTAGNYGAQRDLETAWQTLDRLAGECRSALALIQSLTKPAAREPSTWKWPPVDEEAWLG